MSLHSLVSRFDTFNVGEAKVMVTFTYTISGQTNVGGVNSVFRNVNCHMKTYIPVGLEDSKIKSLLTQRVKDIMSWQVAITALEIIDYTIIS
jgi:hypothetical protein